MRQPMLNSVKYTARCKLLKSLNILNRGPLGPLLIISLYVCMCIYACVYAHVYTRACMCAYKGIAKITALTALSEKS
jgi:hypothetical protein